MYDTFKTAKYNQSGRDAIALEFTRYGGAYYISRKSAERDSVMVNQTYGTGRLNAYEILESTLNLRSVEVKDPVDYIDPSTGEEKTKYVLNKKETILAREKQAAIRMEFEHWLFADPERGQSITKLYNDKFNNLRPRVYDGNDLILPDMSEDIKLRPHQRDVVAHGLYGDGNLLMAHEVGAGKTYAAIVIPFKNLVNDAYCRDISVKIRSQLEVKRKKGDFIGSFAVYGYLKDSNDRHKLVVDDYAAEVVRDIFRWKLEGMSQQRIAERLDDNGILSPMEYKRYCGMSYKSGFQINPKAKWTAVAIGRILKNEFYVGTLVQGKRSAPNHKIKKLFEKPKSEWVRIENSHEAIVEQEIFNTVNRLLSKDTRIAPQEKTVYLFGGMLFCGDCHSNMVRNNNCRNGKTYTYYMCGNNRNTKGCSSHRMRDTVLENAVLSCLKQHIDNILNVEQVLKRIDTLPYRKSGAGRVNGQLEQKIEEIERYKHFKMKLHESLVDNLLEKNEYLDMKAQYDQQQTAAEKDMLRLEKELQTAVYSVSNECGWMDAFRQYQDIAVLTRAVVVTLIDHIVIYENNRIEIVFQYQYDYEQALAVIASFDKEKHPALMERGVL